MSSSHRYPRSARLNEVMLEVLADEVERLSDPRLGFVTLTGMEINRDLSKAAVYYSTLGGTQVAASGTDPVATAAALASAAPHLRTVLGREIRANLRHMEQVLDAFFRDNTKRAELASLSKDSQQIRGALNVLGLPDAERLLVMCEQQIDRNGVLHAELHHFDLHEVLARGIANGCRM